MRLGLALAVTCIASSVAAHGIAQWIQDGRYKNDVGQLCCGEKDCAPLDDKDVAVVEGGYYIKSLKDFVPNAEAQPSPDGHFWRCAWPTIKDRKCFFFPPPGS